MDEVEIVDYEAYTDAKSAYIESVIQKATSDEKPRRFLPGFSP
jgi:hypothetical protein